MSKDFHLLAQMVPAYIYYRLLHPRKSILDRELRERGEVVTVNRCIGDRDAVQFCLNIYDIHQT